MCMCVITSAKSIWINKISLHFGPHWEETATDTQFTLELKLDPMRISESSWEK